MKPLKFALLAAAILPAPMLMAAGEAPAVDTSRWSCKFCPFEDGHSGFLELGAGYVSDESAKFGEYNGLDKQGGYAIGNAGARYRRRDGTWLDLSAIDLGLDSRYLGIQGGRQGAYSLSLQYKELQHAITRSAVTPFLGAGTSTLTLPASWARAGTTGGMSALAGSLHNVDLETQRKQLAVAANLHSVAHWQFGVKFRHEAKTGAISTAGAFAFNAAQLALPIDYDTNQIDVSAAFTGRQLHARLAYYGSKFTNNELALTWSNPYGSSFAGAAVGQLAAAPSNEFHQFLASAGAQLGARTVASADLAMGSMKQNEAFLAATLNPNLSSPPLPRGSLDGRVATVDANLRVTSSVTDKLRLNAAATYDDRDNRTAQAAYAWVTTDTFPATPRTNLPYSFTRRLYRFDASYRLNLGRYHGHELLRNLRLTAGYDYDIRERDLQEISESREARSWGKASVQLGNQVDFSFKGSHARRTVAPYAANPEISPAENPLLRKYNMADRTRDAMEGRIEYAPTARISFGLAGEVGWDLYSRSTLGLLEAQEATWTGDAAFVLSDSTNASLYLNHQQIHSRQAGRPELPVVPIWYATNLDRIDTGGANLRHHASDKLDLGASYTVSRSTGEVTVQGATPAFPELFTRLDSARLYGDYRMKQRLSLHLAYWHEKFRSRNWALDGVAPATIPNVLSLARGAPSYSLNVITLSGRYEF
jgi:MtrB/PioB family decaheme-associated outer membrane protein